MTPLKFHWRLLQGGETSDTIPRSEERVDPRAALPEMEAQINFCRAAEQSGIASLLVDINFGKPDPMMLAAALGRATQKIKFMVACRPSHMCPTLFVQQVNTFSALTNGRINLNMVAGHSPQEQGYYGDFSSHDERYQRMDEFLAICHAFWQRNGGVNFSGKHYQIEGGKLNTPFVSNEGRAYPEICLGGSSVPAQQVAAKHATCWIRFADAPEKLGQAIQPVLQQETEVGLRLSIITRSTREEALQTAYALLDSSETTQRSNSEQKFVKNSDAVSMKSTFELAEDEWLTPYLWTGAVRKYGAPAMALVGTPDEVALGLMAFKQVGVSQFILSGWPKQAEMIRFGRDVLPIIRKQEQQTQHIPSTTRRK